MRKERPVNLDIGTIRFPLPAIVSILHRISGVMLFFVAGLLLWVLDASLSSSQGFADVKACLAHPVTQVVLWGSLAALGYHLVAGIRHLIMDIGIGESWKGGVMGARLVFVVSVILIVLAGVWVW